jgi:molecular chaperone GrpE
MKSLRLANRFQAAWRAFWSAGGSLASRLAGLQLDLHERDEQIARLRQEFALQERQAEQEAGRAAEGGLHALARAAAPLLSQLSTLRAMAEAGREVRAADVLKLAEKIKAVFVEAGLEPLGRNGEVCPFDSRFHQRLSGGDVQEGDPVRIRFEGYRLGDMVLTKAMVSREE